MIYLILDTNIWVYLANGLDPISGKHQDDLHFKLLNELKDNKDICILVNDIVFEEWKRNKEHCEAKIKKLKSNLKNPDAVFHEIEKYTTSETSKLKQEYIDGLIKAIKDNEEHIQKVEDFLFNNCKKLSISKDIKIKVFNLSIDKRAPFHNQKNNIADAAILLSAVEYLAESPWEEDWSAIFVSNNFSDFTDGKDKDNFHPDLKELIDEPRIKYSRILPKALEVSKHIIKQIEEYNNRQRYLDSIRFICQYPDCYGKSKISQSYGYLNDTIAIKYEADEYIDPNQLSLFNDKEFQPIKKERITELRYGRCNFCDILHIECPKCGELIVVEDELVEFECTECFALLEIKPDDTVKEMYLLVKDTEDDEDFS